MKKLKIYLADEHTMFRKTIAIALHGLNDGYMIREANNGKELLSFFNEEIPDFVIIDPGMPELSGRKACKCIVKEFPEVKVIVLSKYDDAEEMRLANESGAHCFLSKYAEPKHLDKAIQDLALGTYRRDWRYSKIDAKPGPLPHETLVKSKIELSKREFTIVSLLCNELTNKQIGYHLGLSQNTIRNHKARIMQKSGVRSTPGLVRMAYEQRFVAKDDNLDAPKSDN